MNKNSTFYFLLILFFLTCAFSLQAQDPIPGGCGIVGPNLVENADFDDGNTGFTNSFTFNQDYTCSFGDYTIASTVVNDPAVTCYNAPGFNLQSIWKVTDRVNLNSSEYIAGNFMIVDPCDTVGTACSTTDLSGIIWEQTVDICPNNTYTFSVYVKNIYTQEAINYAGSDTEPDFELRINGDTISGYYVDGVLSNTGSFSLPKMPEADSAVWFQISGAWESGTSTTANLVMRNLVEGSQGNDLALDAVYMGLCGKEVGADVQGSLCQGSTPSALVFNPDPETQNSSWQYYEWYKDGQLVQGDANGTFIPTLDPVTGYLGDYTLVAYEDPAGGGCGHTSNTIKVIDAATNTETCTVLPVEMLSFNGKQVGQKVALDWATAFELNNKGFDIEISADGEEFSPIGFVEGIGNSNGVNTYTFTTSSLSSGSYIFRLKQIDFDGSFSYSDNVELSVDLNGAFLFSLAPNPLAAEAALTLEVQEKQQVRLDLMSTDGKKVKEIHTGILEAGMPLNLQLSTQGLSDGFYFLSIQGSTFSHYEKIVIAK